MVQVFTTYQATFKEALKNLSDFLNFMRNHFLTAWLNISRTIASTDILRRFFVCKINSRANFIILETNINFILTRYLILQCFLISHSLHLNKYNPGEKKLTWIFKQIGFCIIFLSYHHFKIYQSRLNKKGFIIFITSKKDNFLPYLREI